MRKYAGIGSRETPSKVLELFSLMALRLGQRGWLLRSGGAPGADSAFYAGASSAEIFFPWKGFNDEINESDICLTEPTPEATELAKNYHPAWFKLSQGARKLIARNGHQVLGKDLNDPVDCIICWTEDGKLKGGTAQALRMAHDRKIPVYNLGDPLTFDLFADILQHG